MSARRAGVLLSIREWFDFGKPAADWIVERAIRFQFGVRSSDLFLANQSTFARESRYPSCAGKYAEELPEPTGRALPGDALKNSRELRRGSVACESDRHDKSYHSQ